MKPFAIHIFLILVFLFTLGIKHSDAMAERATSKKTFSKHTIYKNIPYGKSSKPAQTQLDLYVPEHKTADKKPVLVFVHGGAWVKGDKSAVKDSMANTYTSENVIVASLNYRLAPDSQYPINIQDLAKATRWLVDNIHRYGGNRENMILSGHSAGGHLVSLLATNETFLLKEKLPLNTYKAVFSVDSGLYDLVSTTSDGADKKTDKAIAVTFGNNKNTLKDASPTYNVTRGEKISDFYLYAAAKRLPVVEVAKKFESILTKNGHTASVTTIPNKDHSAMMRTIFEKNSIIYKDILSLLVKSTASSPQDAEEKTSKRRKWLQKFY